jgi:hypothetical protein
MVQPDEILRSAHAIVVIGWPTKDVPVTLGRAGLGSIDRVSLAEAVRRLKGLS